MDHKAIGVFDSGVGGLTVLRALHRAVPNESFTYLGDTARLPYGTKSKETIKRYLVQNISFLLKQGVKAIVVACNSASSVLARDYWSGIPIYSVITPGSLAASQASQNRHIGVMGTRATVESGSYVKALRHIDTNIKTYQQACPLLVPLVEEGWERETVTRTVLSHYLTASLLQKIDTLILGCTHYPILKPIIGELLGESIHLVDSADIMARTIRADLHNGKILPSLAVTGTTKIWTTDLSMAFKEVAQRILGPMPVTEWCLADL